MYPDHRLSRMDLPDRYEDLGPLAVGGMGEVRRVQDRRLLSVVAMKISLPEVSASPLLRQRFRDEGRLTAQLHHPGIIAVHDLGQLSDGRLFFTMEEVRGRTLQAIIDEHHTDADSPWSRRRLIEVFWRACQALAYAHHQGVIHRDIKPENLMVGGFGEVRVMDWGLARQLSEAEPEPDAPSGLRLGARLGEHTQVGDVVGTPAFMSPEQARGSLEALGPETDVYALGATLYAILSGSPPYPGGAVSAWRALISETPPAPLPEHIPADLRQICTEAMNPDALMRPLDAGEVAEAVEAWLEGARKQQEALAILEVADTARPEIDDLLDKAVTLRGEADAILGALKPFDPVEKKRPGWQLQDAAADCERQAAVAEAGWLQTVRSALNLVPDLTAAHDRLAAHYQRQLLDAEARRSPQDAARFETHLRSHDRGRFTGFLEGLGAVTLVTDPPGAQVKLFRYELQNRRLVPVFVRDLGRTPLIEVALPRGSYLLTTHRDGHHPVRYPAAIGRGEHWHGVRPGSTDAFPIVLPRLGTLREDDCYVPAGWFIAGGDPEAIDSLPRQKVWVDAFTIRRYPVTNREYLAWLNVLVAEGREEEALRHVPRTSNTDDFRYVYKRDGARRFVLGQDHEERTWQPEWPVAGIDWFSAVAFSENRKARLPHELEWEKAARGVDGRMVSWGDHIEPTWANILGGQDGQPCPTNVSTPPNDVSPYGVWGMVGGVRDFCENLWEKRGPAIRNGHLIRPSIVRTTEGFRSSRGGAWISVPKFSRAATRFASPPTHRFVSLGIRIVTTKSAAS